MLCFGAGVRVTAEQTAVVVTYIQNVPCFFCGVTRAAVRHDIYRGLSWIIMESSFSKHRNKTDNGISISSIFKFLYLGRKFNFKQHSEKNEKMTS